MSEPQPEPRISITRIVLAVTQVEAMVRFYGEVFELPLMAQEAHGSTLYKGSLGGITLMLCPNSVAQVQAEQARHQLSLAVPDLARALGRVRELGCPAEVHGQDDLGPSAAIVRDPDGNTLELKRA